MAGIARTPYAHDELQPKLHTFDQLIVNLLLELCAESKAASVDIKEYFGMLAQQILCKWLDILGMQSQSLPGVRSNFYREARYAAPKVH
eukprot:5985493-Pleurochrysis_carterae.AAC.1